MANCEHERKLHAYYDEELSPEERREVEEHVQQCPACAGELEDLRRLSGFFASARLPELPADALERLHRGRGTVLERVLIRTSEYFTAAAAVILVGCAALLLHSQADEFPATNALPAWQMTAVEAQADTTVNDSETGVGVAQVIVADLTR